MSLINMKYYILQNREMPWGDYGDILFEGLLTVMDDDYNDIDVHEIERTGPYIPEIYCANSTNLVVSENIKNILIENNITGIEKFHNTIFKKIVNIDWKSWDHTAKAPEFYPESGEPIDYIEEGENDKKLISKIEKQYFSLDLEKQPRLSHKDKTIKFIDYRPNFDLFIAGKSYILTSEKFKNLIESKNIDTLEFTEIQSKQ